MKIFALILSVYVIALTAMPCSDDIVTDVDSFSIEILEESQNHAEDIDLCSPFCFCNCCQTLSFLNIFNNSHYTLIGSEFSFIVVEQIYPNPTISFWRPPKI